MQGFANQNANSCHAPAGYHGSQPYDKKSWLGSLLGIRKLVGSVVGHPNANSCRVPAGFRGSSLYGRIEAGFVHSFAGSCRLGFGSLEIAAACFEQS